MAPILGGYEMSAAAAPAPHAKWRIIAIPGTPSRPHMWTRFMRLAPDDLDISAVNRAGYGGPMYGDERRTPVLSFDDQIAAIAPLIEKDERPAVVVGVSYGGALALKAALDFPDRVKGVVTVAALVTEPRGWVLGVLPAAEWPGIRSILPAYLHNARAEVQGRRAQIADVFGRLNELEAPVTIMHGDFDWLVAEQDAAYLRSCFAPDQDVVYQPVAGGTHYLELLNPRTVYAAVRDVIARAEARTRAAANDTKDTEETTT